MFSIIRWATGNSQTRSQFTAGSDCCASPERMEEALTGRERSGFPEQGKEGQISVPVSVAAE